MAQELLQRYNHYVAKMDTQRISNVIDAIKDIAYGNFTVEWEDFYNVREAARTYLGSVGEPVGLFPGYLAFAQQTRQNAKRYSGTTLTDLVQAEKNVWEERGYVDATLIAIAALQGITVT